MRLNNAFREIVDVAIWKTRRGALMTAAALTLMVAGCGQEQAPASAAETPPASEPAAIAPESVTAATPAPEEVLAPAESAPQTAAPAEQAAPAAVAKTPAAEKAATPVPVADAAHGAQLFNSTCRACHGANGAGSMAGPSLQGVVGRAAATADGFAYSEALKASGLTWNEANLKAFISNPRGTVPGTKMMISGPKGDQDLTDLTAYLKTLK